MPSFDRQDLEDMIADAIGDSMDMDWTYRDGARAVIRALEEDGILKTHETRPNPPRHPTGAEQ
jgi:hypothetical protein